MKWIVKLIPLFILGSSLLAAPPHRLSACLPDGIKSNDIVSTQMVRSAAGDDEVKKLTVERILIRLKAQCKKGKLVDAKGKEIYFFRLQGCWGNPPADYQEILKQQQEQLDKLKQRYTVIEMTCNPEGTRVQ